MSKPYTEEQIVGILREAKAKGTVVRALCRKHKIPEQTFYRWRNKYGGMSVSEVRKLKELEEQARLKKMPVNQ